MDGTVTDVLPSQARALLRPKTAINEHCGDIAEQEWILWFDWCVVPFDRLIPVSAR
jgi:hypothetical protein